MLASVNYSGLEVQIQAHVRFTIMGHLYLLCFAFLLSRTIYRVNLRQYYKMNVKR